jgi:hypothetical protein
MTKAKASNDKNLQPMERLLLWRLAISGGAWLKDLKPVPDTKHRASLKGAGLITEEKRRPEQGGPAATFIEATDDGWNWLAVHATEPMTLNPRATTAPTLEALVLKLGKYLESKQENLADFLHPSQGAPSLVVEPSAPLDDLTGRVAAAYEKITGGRAAVRVRLADLRASLSDVPRDDLDRAILRLAADGIVSLYPLDNPLEIEPRDREAALRTPAGDLRHILYMGRMPS